MAESTHPAGASRIQSLITAAEQLFERRQHEPLTVRQLADEAGMPETVARSVMPDERAMVDVLAENAMTHLLDAISRLTTTADLRDPNARVTAIAQGFLDWAINRPTEFQMISDRNLVDLHGTVALRRLNDSVRDLLTRSLAESQRQGRLAPEYNLDVLALTGRAVVYGLARMVTDGHLEEWAGDSGEDPKAVAERALTAYLVAMYRM